MIHPREELVLSPQTPSTDEGTEGAVESLYFQDIPVKSDSCIERNLCVLKGEFTVQPKLKPKTTNLE